MDPQTALEQQRKRFGLGASWVGSWPLGDGAYGTVSLFLKQNKKAKIVDRIAIKEARCKPSERGIEEWDNPVIWTTGGGGRKIPTEVYAMQALKGHSGSEYVVNLRNWRIQSDPPQFRMLRLYMEPCLKGDLWDVISFNKGVIPEPFLWYVFEALATVGNLTEFGHMGGRFQRGHKPILHRDYKSPNILLGAPSNKKFRGYPTPKVGDWGLSTVLERHDPRPVESFIGAGTPGHRPVEAVEASVFPGSSFIFKPNSKVDIFGVGMVIFSLMMHSEGASYIVFDPDLDVVHADPQGLSKLHIEPQLSERAVASYSEELVNMVIACTRYHPDQRPTFHELLSNVLEASAKQPGTRMARNAPAKDESWQEIPVKVRKNLAEIGAQLDNNIIRADVATYYVPHGLGKFPDPPRFDEDRGKPPGGPTGEEIDPSLILPTVEEEEEEEEEAVEEVEEEKSNGPEEEEQAFNERDSPADEEDDAQEDDARPPGDTSEAQQGPAPVYPPLPEDDRQQRLRNLARQAQSFTPVNTPAVHDGGQHFTPTNAPVETQSRKRPAEEPLEEEQDPNQEEEDQIEDGQDPMQEEREPSPTPPPPKKKNKRRRKKKNW